MSVFVVDKLGTRYHNVIEDALCYSALNAEVGAAVSSSNIY